MTPVVRRFERSVFINCPFDRDYLSCFEALTFSILACGFTPRCALETVDSTVSRLDRICAIVRGCRFGIHDLSRIETYPGLPRFNMPFELGLDLGARRFGSGRRRSKALLVLETDPYRYQRVLSDISGQDIRAHGGDPDRIVSIVRDWLRSYAGGQVAGPVGLQHRFAAFSAALPDLCAAAGLERRGLAFRDYVTLARSWLMGA